MDGGKKGEENERGEERKLGCLRLRKINMLIVDDKLKETQEYKGNR